MSGTTWSTSRNGSAVSGATQDFTAGTYASGGGTLVTVSGRAWQNLASPTAT